MRIRRRNSMLAACAAVIVTAGLNACVSHGNGAGASTGTGVPATTSSASVAHTASAVIVTRCALQAEGGNASRDAQPPATVSDFRGVQFDQSSMSFFGVSLRGAAQTVLGQAGANCSYDVGADGSTYITITGSRASLYETYLPGGIDIIAQELCDTFPQAVSTVNGQLANIGAEGGCTASPSSSVHELPTGLPIHGLYVGISAIPGGSDRYLALELPASSHDTTWQLDYGNTQVVTTAESADLDFKSMACAAPPADKQLCTASLEYFVSGLITQAGYGKPSFATLFENLANYIR